MNVLYIAYSCDPYEGSEDRIGWSVPAEAAKNNRVFVLTKEEHRESIERFMKDNSVRNMEFFFVDIPHVYKKLFRGFLYSGRLGVWNRRAFSVAKKICTEHEIDVIHQITPVEFRAIGEYYKIQNVKFICGPLGGGERIPKGLRLYAKRNMFVETVRALINVCCMFSLKCRRKLDRCDKVMFANEETRSYLLGDVCDASKYPVATEIGTDTVHIDCEESHKKIAEKTIFLAVGRMIYRKGFSFLLDAIEGLSPDYNFECRVVGGGPDFEKLKTRCQNSEKISKHVVFTGVVPHQNMEQEYLQADVFILPSIRETTGSVLLEAMSKGLPVITIGKFGGGVLVNDEAGWLYEGTDRASYIRELRNAMESCMADREQLLRKGQCARKRAAEYTWEKKTAYYQALYREALGLDDCNSLESE